jgi:hypothetical protein
MASVVEVAGNSVSPSGAPLAAGCAQRGRHTRLVLDNNRSAKADSQLSDNLAAEKVGGAPRRIRHDHLDGVAG